MASMILIVDDSLLARRQAVQALAAAGFQTTEAADGVEALAVVRAEQPALIICDVNMPRMNGLEFLEALQELPVRPTVVMLTSECEPDALLRARELGAAAWMQKPTKPTHLVATADKLLGGRR